MKNRISCPFEAEQFIRDQLGNVVTAGLSTQLAMAASLTSDQKFFTKGEIRKILKVMVADAQKSLAQEKKNASSAEIAPFVLPPGVVIPDQYEVSALGISMNGTDKGGSPTTKTITRRPVLITAKWASVDDNSVGVQLSFPVGNSTREIACDQDEVASSQKIVGLSRVGVDVNSNNARDLIEFFSVQQSASDFTLPRVYTTSKSGWGTLNKRKYFVAGYRVFSDDNSIKVVRTNASGSESIQREIDQHGSFEVWAKAMSWLCEHPIILFTVGVAMASPLLKPLGVSNFTFHIFGNSTCGKSIAARAALSFYGSPNDDGLLLTWKTTETGLEGRLVALDGLPVSIDDSSQAPSDDFVSNAIYTIGNGQGKSRGGINGEAKDVASFSVACLSNGEKPCSTSTSLRGQEVRTIEVGLPPILGNSADIENRIKSATSEIGINYGFGCERYLNHLVALVNDRERLDSLKSTFTSLRSAVLLASPNRYVKRTADFFAVIKLALQETAMLFPELGITGEKIGRAINVVFEEHCKGLSDTTNVDAKALALIWDKIAANPDRFHPCRQGTSCSNQGPDRIPSGGMWGRETFKDLDSGERVKGYALLADPLKKILVEGGFSFKATIEHFKRNGWIWLRSDGSLWNVTISGNSYRCYVFDSKTSKAAGILGSDGEVEKPRLYSVPSTSDADIVRATMQNGKLAVSLSPAERTPFEAQGDI